MILRPWREIRRLRRMLSHLDAENVELHKKNLGLLRIVHNQGALIQQLQTQTQSRTNRR